MREGPKEGSFLSRIHLDPTVSLGHIITTIGLVIAGLWWAAEMYTRVELNTSNIAVNSALIARNEAQTNSRIQIAEERAERGRLENRDYLQRIEDKLDRLIEKEID